MPFLDANILFSAAHAPQARMRRLWMLAPPPSALLTSDQAILEAARNLPTSTHPALLDLLQDVRIVGTPPRHRRVDVPSVSLPDDDMAILQAAIAGAATHFLTGNRRHFGSYFGRRIVTLIVLPPAAYRTSKSDAAI